MTESEASQQEQHSRPQRRSCFFILGHSLKLYIRHWKAFTLTLLWPVGQILLGMYASQILTLLFTQWAQPFFATFPVPVLSGVLLIALGSVFLILRGTWQYLVYWASLSINAWEAEEDRPIDFKGAYQSIVQTKKLSYSVLVATYFSLPLLVLIPVFIMSAVGALLGQQMLELLFIVGMLQSFVLSLGWILSLILFSFVFQVAAFEKGIPVNPGPTFMLSAKLVLKRFWETLGLQLIVFLTTNFLIPQPIVLLANLTQLSKPLDWLHHWLIRQLLTGNSQDLVGQPSLIENLLQNNEHLAQLLAQTLTAFTIGGTLTLLLLPFGTIVFTLLYKDILRCDRSKKTLLSI